VIGAKTVQETEGEGGENEHNEIVLSLEELRIVSWELRGNWPRARLSDGLMRLCWRQTEAQAVRMNDLGLLLVNSQLRTRNSSSDRVRVSAA
jgi:hypothetical protein